MRGAGIFIGVAVCAHVVWRTLAPFPSPSSPCPDQTHCEVARAEVAIVEDSRPALQVAVYDPAMAPARMYEHEEPHASWVSSAESELGAVSVVPGPRPQSLLRAVHVQLAAFGKRSATAPQ